MVTLTTSTGLWSMTLCFQIQKNRKQKEGEHSESMFNNGAVVIYWTFIRQLSCTSGNTPPTEQLYVWQCIIFLAFLDDRFLMKAKNIKGKTTWSQRITNWSYYSSRYKTTIQKTSPHHMNQKVHIICTHSNNHGLAFNQKKS